MAKSYCETGISAPTRQITVLMPKDLRPLLVSTHIAHIYSYRLRHRHTNITIINKYLKCVYGLCTYAGMYIP